MTRLEAITEAYVLATGKTTLPAVGQAKRSLLTNLCAKFYRDWQTEPSVGEWNSLYGVVGAGTVAAGTTVYTLDTPIHFISERTGNTIRIRKTDGSPADFLLITPQQLYQYRNNDAVALVNGNQLQFSREFPADSDLIGGTIEVPAITKLDDLVDDTSDILIDNPAWLPVRIAAQYCYSYRSLRDMYPDLLDQANELMQGMINQNTPINSSYHTGIDYFGSLGNVGNDIGQTL